MPTDKHTFTTELLSFEQLGFSLLYQILSLRQQVFIVEQQSIYHDIDNRDLHASHLILTTHPNKLIGYARILPPDTLFPESSIGRIVIDNKYRGQSLGRRLIRKAIHICFDMYPESSIRITAQEHLQHFYESFGFTKDSLPYDDGGIPHIEMILTLSAFTGSL